MASISCGLARPRTLVGGKPTQVAVSHGPGIQPCRCSGNPAQAGLTVKALSPDKTVMGEADGVYGPAGNSPLYGRGECKGLPRGLRPCRALHGDYAVTREIRQSAQKEAHPWTSVRSKEEGGGGRKSEASIRARRSGNAGGAKGCRFERAGQGDMGRHRAGETMTTRLTRLTQKVQPSWRTQAGSRMV